jgi:hypothetical protein
VKITNAAALLNAIQEGVFVLGRKRKISCICRMKHLSVHIDRLTNSLRNAITGDVFTTELYKITAKDKPLLRKDWLFDWVKEMNNAEAEVWKLVIVNNPSVIQGLVSISDRDDHIFVNLVENASYNIGKNKVYEGVGANLFAFACQRSFASGYDGVVSFIAKSTLIAHYSAMLGAKRLGSSLRMIIDTPQARSLCERYFPSSQQ